MSRLVFAALADEINRRRPTFKGKVWAGYTPSDVAGNILQETQPAQYAAELMEQAASQVVGDANTNYSNSEEEIVEGDDEVPDEESEIEETFSELLISIRGDDNAQPSASLVRPGFQESYAANKPCPYCGKPLRTNQAQQCFECGANWRGKSNTIT